MLNPMLSKALSATWPQRLTSAIKTAWAVTFRQPAQPVIASPLTASKPVLFSVRTIPAPTRPDVACLVVEGVLNHHTYTSLIDLASTHYDQGRSGLLLDLRQTTQIELSGFFALLNIARLYSGQTLLDPEAGWAGLHAAVEEITPALGERVKLIAPSSEVATALAGTSFSQFFGHYADYETALAAFPYT